MKKTTITLVASLAVLLGSQFALAKGPGRGGPPPEAFTACEGKAVGDVAEFSGRGGEAVAGTCVEQDGKMVLKPTNHPERPERPAQAE